MAQPVPDIAGHHAVVTPMQVGAGKNCMVSVDVTVDEFVRVGISEGEDPAKTCETAKAAAAVVAGRLPA